MPRIENTRTSLLLVSSFLSVALVAVPARASCPIDPPPDACDNNGQFVGGRWDLSQFTGTYTVSGSEVFRPFLEEPDLSDDYQTSGSLSVSMDGGADENYLDVDCDGNVTGQFKQRYQGNIDKTEMVSYYNPEFCIQSPQDMNWTILVERTVTVNGQVSGFGQLDVDLSVDTATIDVNGSLAASFDCVFISGSMSVMDFDISGDTEQVRLSGGYDPDNGRFAPEITTLSGKPWIDDILHRVKLNGTHEFQDNTLSVSPSLDGASGSQAALQEYNTYLIQDAVAVSGNTSAEGEPKTPAITSMELQEPSQYLQDVNVDTQVIAEIDWRGQAPGQVEFTYGGTTETVSGGDSVTWDFDAGESGTTIEAVAINGSERSEPYTINVPKVTVPGWAGSSSDWSGSSGIQYEASLNWPVSLETTRTISTIDLFTGIWGISGSASSEFNAKANSNGSPGSGDMTTQAQFRFAGRSTDLSMEGPNETTLSCDELSTTGSATATVNIPPWQKTLSPASLVPGLQAGACALSRVLCGVVNSIGIKASAEVTLEGTPTYMGQGSDIRWDGGSLGGSITGKISAGASVPPPLSSVASVEIYGSATGCLEFQVAPDIELTSVGGTLNAGASATFLGSTSSTETEEPFGDGCGKSWLLPGAFNDKGVPAGWVPADGQLAMAATEIGGALVGIAVWSETPAGQARPLGDIVYRFYRDGAWSPIRQLTGASGSDIAPSVAFDGNGRALVVFQRSTIAPPGPMGDLTGFANGYELHWALIDGGSELSLDEGQITVNAAHDMGPRLRRDRSGGLHLFWQRVSGVEISGTAGSPVSLMVASWSGSSWASEVAAAAGLSGTFGWSPAPLSSDRMLIGLVLDTDNDLATDQDRELFQLSSEGGIWGLPQQVTDNIVADDAALATFDASANPLLLWRRGNEVLEVRGDPLAGPTPAFTTADPAMDDGISAAFAAGLVDANGGAVVVGWTEGLAVHLAEESGSGGWDSPAVPFATGESEVVHFLGDVDGSRVVGYAVREFVPGSTSLAPVVLPAFADLGGGLGSDRVFRNGFE